MKKFVNIQIQNEGNIGVIDLGKLNLQEDKVEYKIKKTVEKKLVEALRQRFDCPVKIRLTEVVSIFPIIVRTSVVIESELEDYVQGVEMEETWVY